MLPKYNLALVLSFTIFGCCIGDGRGKYTSGCEFLYKFMKYYPHVSHEYMNKWACIAQYQSYSNRLSASQIYNAYCAAPRDYASECLYKKGAYANNIFLNRFNIAPKWNKDRAIEKKKKKIYGRCELARELYYVHRVPFEQIATWVCIAEHESNLNTAAVGHLNHDGSLDHGLFQISDIYWCSAIGPGKACGRSCSKFEDSNISDDVECIKKIYNEHQRLSGNGFNAWAVYKPHCTHQTAGHIKACFY